MFSLLEERSESVADYHAGQMAQMRGGTWLGSPQSIEAAVSVTVVQAAVRLVSGQIARAPMYVLHPDGTSDEPPEWLLQPDPEDTCANTISQMVMSLMLDGNAYALITGRDASGPLSIRVLNPRMVDVSRPSPEAPLEYRVQNGGQLMLVPRHRVIHAKGMCYPGDDKGVGPITFGARLMGLAVAETNYAALRFHPGDRGPAIPEYVVETDAALSQDQANRIVKQIKKKVTGQERGPLFLHSGARAKVLELSAQDLELIVSRKFSDVQLCTMMGVQPHLLGVQVENSMTYSNVLMDQLGFKTFTLEDWANRLGAGLALRTLPRGDVLKFDLDELSRDLAMPGATLEIDGAAQTAKFTSQGGG